MVSGFSCLSSSHRHRPFVFGYRIIPSDVILYAYFPFDSNLLVGVKQPRTICEVSQLFEFMDVVGQSAVFIHFTRFTLPYSLPLLILFGLC